MVKPITNPNPMSGMVHIGGESSQDGLEDVQTCGTTLALAYVLHRLSTM